MTNAQEVVNIQTEYLRIMDLPSHPHQATIFSLTEMGELLAFLGVGEGATKIDARQAALHLAYSEGRLAPEDVIGAERVVEYGDKSLLASVANFVEVMKAL